jgi:hypothetical protein
MAHRFGSPTPYDVEESSRRKKKRYLSRSDEEIREEMDGKNLAYRRGWPSLLTLPLETIEKDAEEMVDNAKDHLRKVQAILAAQRITHPRLFFAFRIPRDIDETDSPTILLPFLTLVFTADFEVDPHKIEHAIIQIRASFRDDISTENVTIEALDFRAIHNVPSYPIVHTEKDILMQWDSVAEVVIQNLEGESWLSLELLRRGLSKDVQRCPPTVVITSPNARDPKWYEQILQSIRGAIRSIAPSFELELLCENTLFGSRRRYRPTEYVGRSAYGQQVVMGSSIGIWNDERGSSTLGGAMTLEGDVACGITNWHCVLDSRLENSESFSNQFFQ